MNRNDILRKLERLLALSQDKAVTKHEAESSLLMSQNIMLKYDITFDDIEEFKKTSSIIEKILFIKKRRHVWDKFILSLLQTFFHVEFLRTNNGACIIVGEQVHVEFAIRLYSYLKSVFITQYKEYRRIHKRSQAQAFYYGLYTGLYQKLLSNSKECVAIQLYKKQIDNYLHEKYTHMETDKAKTISIYDTRSYERGEKIGGQVVIQLASPNHVLE